MAKRGTSPEWITPQEFQALAEKSATPATVRHLALRKQYVPEIDRKAIDDEQRTVLFRISSGARDRDRDTIKPSGWHLDSYRRNPTVLWAHDYSGLPIGKAVSIETRPDALLSVAQFASRDLYPFADTVYQMIRAGFLSATSVGFRPLAWAYNEEERGVDFSEQELLEFSIVPVPANPECLIEARSAGLDMTPLFVWAEEKLDAWKKEDRLFLPKSQVEAVFQILSTHKFVSAPESAEKGVSPRDVSDETAPEDTAWSAPALGDFTAESWDDISDAEKRRIAGHYAWAVAMPPATFGDLKLPHHRASDGNVVWRGVAAAMGVLMGGRGGADIPSADRRKVYDHLSRHYRQWEKEPPEFRDAPAEVKAMHEGMADQMDECIGDMRMADQYVEKAKARMEGMRGMMDETEERTAKGFNPGAFPLETSWEWVRERLARTAKEYLTRLGARVRENDWAVVAATFPARAVVAVIGPDRPYADDICYEVGWTETADGPAWSGEPQEIDVAVHAEIVPVLRAMKVELIGQKLGRVLSAANERRLRNAAQKNQECHDEIMSVIAQVSEEPETEALEITDAKSADPVLDIAEPAEEELTITVPENGSGNGNITHEDISRAMAEAAQSILSNMDGTVERAVTATINRLRGRID